MSQPDPTKAGNAANRAAKKIVGKFQRDMQKLGLGVSISVPGKEPVAVTTWCPACDHVAQGKAWVCPQCGKDIPDA